MDGKFCVECGKKLPMSAAFCDSCGTKQPHVDFPAEIKMPENTVSLADSASAEGTDGSDGIAKNVNSFAGNAASESSPAQNSQEYSGFYQQSTPQYVPPVEETEEISVYDENGGVKPWYIVVLALALVVTAGLVWALFALNEGLITDESSTSSYSIVTQAPVTDNGGIRTKPRETTKSKDDGYSGVGGQSSKKGEVWDEGGYIVGRDIPEGMYLVYPDIDKYSDTFNEFGSEDEFVMERTFSMSVNEGDKDIVDGWWHGSAYVNLKEGQHISVAYAKIYKYDTKEVKNDPFKFPGAFIVGKDVEAGTYSFKYLTDQGYENYALFDDVDDFMENNGFNRYEYSLDDKTVTLEDGQLLIMEWCCLDKNVKPTETTTATTAETTSATTETTETKTTTTTDNGSVVFGSVTTVSDTYKGVSG